MAGSKKVLGVLFTAALATPVALGAATAASASESSVDVLVADGAVQATAACSGAAAFSSVSYKVNGTSVPDLSTGLPEGATVEASFVLAPGCDSVQVGLAAYQAPTPTFDSTQIEKQTLFVHQTGVFSSGTTNTLTVTVPQCYYQVDFFTGGVLTQLTPTTNYTSQGRLVDAGHGGTSACVEVHETTTTRPETTTTTEVTTTSSTVPTEVRGEVVERPDVLGATVQPELAETGLPTGPLTGLGAALTLAGSALSGAALRIRANRGKHFRQ